MKNKKENTAEKEQNENKHHTHSQSQRNWTDREMVKIIWKSSKRIEKQNDENEKLEFKFEMAIISVYILFHSLKITKNQIK